MPPHYLLSGPVYCCLSSIPLWPCALLWWCLPGCFCLLQYGFNSSSEFICSPLFKLLANLLNLCNTFYNGGSLSTISKFGPQAKSLSCAVDKGLLEMLMTQYFLGLVVLLVVNVSLAVEGVTHVFSTVSPAICCCFDACLPYLPCCWFKQPPLFFGTIG